MAPRKAVKVQKTRKPIQFSKIQARESEIYSHDSSADESYSEKDETEKRLEKLIFGDEAGFLESIKSHQPENAQLILMDEWEDRPEDQDEGDLDNVPDGDVRRSGSL
jgi:U3 small nucleolar RNA-associated protein 18